VGLYIANYELVKGWYEMKYYLRNITEKDKNFIYSTKKSSIYDYVQKIWGWDEEYQIKDFESNFILENFRIILVEGKDIGFVQIIEKSLNINITEIHIISEYQGYGIGSSIVNRIIEQASNNMKTVTIGCFIDNFRAKDLYERLGFEVIKVTDTHYEMKYQPERVK
jgi:ribosomal protein S18 acetylase RimI-like enzyme